MRAHLLQRDVGRLRADLLPAVRAHSLVGLLAQPAQARGAEGVAAREEQRWLPLLAAHQLEADAAPARSGTRARVGRAQAGRRPGEDPRLHCRAHAATALRSSAEGATVRKREGTSSSRDDDFFDRGGRTCAPPGGARASARRGRPPRRPASRARSAAASPPASARQFATSHGLVRGGPPPCCRAQKAPPSPGAGRARAPPSSAAACAAAPRGAWTCVLTWRCECDAGWSRARSMRRSNWRPAIANTAPSRDVSRTRRQLRGKTRTGG